MSAFRYEAINAQSIPVHGTVDADSEAALVERLAARDLQLVSATELSLDSLVGGRMPDLPRLYQLRIGESLREAYLTGLPAHEAVRAIAAEPFSHPILGLFPWLQLMAAVVFGVSLLSWLTVGHAAGPPWLTGMICCVLIPAGCAVAWFVGSHKPRRLLHQLADRLESGEADMTTTVGGLPVELRTIMQSEIESTQKLRTVAELVPTLSRSGIHTQQFAINLIGPLAMISIVLLGLYALLAFVVPDFRRIFEDFGTELPVMTMTVIDLSRMLAAGGSTGWCVSAVIALGMLFLLFWLLNTGKMTELLESVPLLGIGFRWNLQARVARVLAAMVRNDCDYAQSIRTATASCGSSAVRLEGGVLASRLESGSTDSLPTQALGGLPFSMLFSTDDNSSGSERRGRIADTFDSLADMMQNATVSQGRLLAVMLHFLTLTFGAFCIGFGVIAMFLPLIKLLNDLS